MKKLIFLFLLLPLFLSAQTNQYETYGQLYNTANLYNGTALPGNFNNQYDTITTTGTVALYTAKWVTGKVAIDTAVPSPIFGYGNVTLQISITKVLTNNDSVNVQPLQSIDGISWAPCPGVVATHLAATSQTIPTSLSFDLGSKKARYYGLQVTGLGAVGSLSVRSYFYLNKAFTYYQQ